jgi:hypothetical protein
MPWQECSKVDERLKFVARLLEGEKMAVLCREFDFLNRASTETVYVPCIVHEGNDLTTRYLRAIHHAFSEVD